MPPAAWAAAIWLVACMARDSSEALTTFGKTNNANTPPPKPTPPPVCRAARPPTAGGLVKRDDAATRGRECTRETDCAGIQGTSCVRGPSDGKMRCLCGDNTSPLNGRCEAKFKGLRHICLLSSECMEGMACLLPNATAKGPKGVVLSSTTKLCLCNEDEGYVDRDFYCSDGVIHNSMTFAIVLGAIVSWLRREIYI